MREEPTFEQQIVERIGRLELDLRVIAERITHLGTVALALVEALKQTNSRDASPGLRRPLGA